VGGLSGTGKSTLARAMAPNLGHSPGAVVLRSDEIRKRIFGREPKDRLGPEAYARDVSERVYGEMFVVAGRLLRAGAAVFLDAVFLDVAERDQAEALARDAGADFRGVWLEAPAEVLRTRVEGRRGDASDADRAVLDRQLPLEAGPITWRRVSSADSRSWVEDALAQLRPGSP